MLLGVFEALYQNYLQRYNIIKRGLYVKYFMLKNHILASILKIKLNVVNSYQDNLIINTVAVFLGWFQAHLWEIFGLNVRARWTFMSIVTKNGATTIFLFWSRFVFAIGDCSKKKYCCSTDIDGELLFIPSVFAHLIKMRMHVGLLSITLRVHGLQMMLRLQNLCIIITKVLQL